MKEELGSIEPNGVSKLLLYFCSVHKKTFALSEQLLGSAKKRTDEWLLGLT